MAGSWRQADAWRREDLLDQAQLVARAVRLSTIQSFSGTAADLELPAYQRLERQLAAARQTDERWERIYLLGRREGGMVFFFLDSKDEAEKDTSTAGRIYEEAADPLHQVFDTGRPLVEGPRADRRGVRVSPLVPIRDPQDGRVVAALGIDVDAGDWRRKALGTGTVAVLASGAALFVPLLVVLLCFPGRCGGGSWRLDVVLVLVTGLAITLARGTSGARNARRHRQEAFSRYAAVISSRAETALADLRDRGFGSFVSFFRSSNAVGADDFARFAQHLEDNPAIRSWGWAPAVPSADRGRFEREMRAAGDESFRIWERGRDGRPVEAADRDVHYPLSYLVTVDRSSGALGFDLASEPRRAAAMAEAIGTGLPTVTDAIQLGGGTESTVGLVAMAHVRMESPAVGQPQSGLVLATVELDTILRLTAGGMLFSPGGEMAHIELRELREDGSSVRMAGTAPAGAEASRGASWAHHVQPIFILGRTYALILRPGPGFAAEYPLRAGWSAIVHGMLLTAAAAWLAVVLGAQRRRLEEAVESRTADLRASLERFGQLSEHSRALIWEVDPDGLFTYVSDNVLDILGYSPAELVGRRRFHDLFPETDREECMARVAEISGLHGAFHGYETPVLAKDGRRLWFLTDGVPMYSESGAYAGYRGADRDITDRKEADDALRKRDEMLGKLSSQVPGLFYLYRLYPDRRSRMPFASEGIRAIYELSSGDVAADARPIFERIHPDDRQRVVESILASCECLAQWTCDYRVILPARGIRWHRGAANPERLDDGSTLWHGFIADITDRKRIEEALRRSEEEYRTLFREMLDGFALHEIVCDEAGRPVDYRFLNVNPAFERMTGLKAADIVGRTVLEVLPGTEPYWIERYGKVALGGEPILFESDAGQIGKRFQVSAFRPAAGQFACVFADVTERESLRGQLAQSQRLESIGMLAGGVAHEFNNMLQVILGNAELALEDLSEGAPCREEVEEIRRVGRRASELTRQLLAFARKQTVAPEVLDLNQSATGLLGMLRRLLGEGIELHWAPAEGLWLIEMDPGQVSTILMNLCVNARDAIRDTGRIVIECRNATVSEAQCADLADARPGEYVLLSVGDDGCGMDRETLAKVFEPFFTTKAVGEGTGLGLPTVHGIALQNGGFVAIRSTPGEGTTVCVYLPRYLGGEDPVVSESDGGEDALAAGRRRDGSRGRGRGRHPLGMRHGPRQAGIPCSALQAAATEALRLVCLEESRIDLLVTDVVMPEMSGRELAREIARSHPGIPLPLRLGPSCRGASPTTAFWTKEWTSCQSHSRTPTWHWRSAGRLTRARAVA